MVTNFWHDLNHFAESFTDGGRTVIHEANAIPRVVKHLETDSPMIKHYRTACISQLAKDGWLLFI